MGNCLFSQGADDQSLLNESEGGSLPGELPPADQQVRWWGSTCTTTERVCSFSSRWRLQTLSCCSRRQWRSFPTREVRFLCLRKCFPAVSFINLMSFVREAASLFQCTIPTRARPAWPAIWPRRSRFALHSGLVSSSTCPKASTSQEPTHRTRKCTSKAQDGLYSSFV